MNRAPQQQWKPGMPAQLATENYVLRTLTPADVTDRMVEWFSDPEVMRFVDLPINMPREHVEKFVSIFDNKIGFCFGIFDRTDRTFVGFFHVHCDPRSRNARTAVVIGEKEYWGKGVVLETRAVLLDFLFGVLRLHKVWGAIYSRNLPSLFNYKAQGFKYEGLLREESQDREGGWHDIYRFGMLRDEWIEIRRRGTDSAS